MSSIKAATVRLSLGTKQTTYLKGIDCLKEKEAKCIEVMGDYIEK